MSDSAPDAAQATVRVAMLPGDGVGAEVADSAAEILRAAFDAEGRRLELSSHLIGWAAVSAGLDPLPSETLEACLAADAVFLGAVGDPASEGVPPERRPERGLLGLRRELGCWANLRPVRLPEALIPFSPLRESIARGTDLLFVRELGGGLYYGEPREEGTDRALNTFVYTEAEVRRIAELAVDLAVERSGRLTSVDKANVLEVSRLWRRVTDEVVAGRADLELGVEHILVDRMAMELVLRPTRFDVIVTSNLFGDILSDEAAAVVGSLGLLPSASLGGHTDLYEPVHGSAPDIAGEGIANPAGAIGSVAMMLRHTFEMHDAAQRIEQALDRAFERGIRTPDLQGTASTTGMTAAVLDEMTQAAT